LANGYFGAAISGGARGLPLRLFLNSNGHWGCNKAPNDSVVSAVCARVALGGLQLDTSWDERFSVFHAEQRIANGTVFLQRKANDTGDTLQMEAQMHPEEDVLALAFRWQGAQPLTLSLSTFVFGAPFQADTACMSVPALPRTLAGAPPTLTASNNSCGPGEIATVSRRLNATATPQAPAATADIRQMWTALATRIVNTGYAAAVDQSAPYPTPLPTNAGGRVQYVVLQPNVTLSVIVALADNLNGTAVVAPNPLASGPSPVSAAVALACSVEPSAVVAAATEFWTGFYNASSVATPEAPNVMAFWWGAQYITAIMSPSAATLRRRPLAPAFGLYGPWVTSDSPSWNGDYTLDYNFEAQFYGVFTSNHPDLAAAYVQPISAWMPAARRQAQQVAAAANISCDPKTLSYACHLAPWGYQSRDQTTYMHWNGFFAALPLIAYWETTLDSAFARATLYPLLDGLNAWSHCYLVRRTVGSGGDYVYDDYRAASPDEEHEQQPVPNPQIGLALLRRVAHAQLALARALNVTAPSYVDDIGQHLAPYNAAPNGFPFTAFETLSGRRCSGEYHMGGEPTYLQCKEACYWDDDCAFVTFCDKGEKGGPAGFCPEAPTCWRYRRGANCSRVASYFVSGQKLSWPGTHSISYHVWTAYENATVDQSDAFSLYPLWPSEDVDTADSRAVSDDQAALACASVMQYADFASGRPVLVFSAAVRGGKRSSAPYRDRDTDRDGCDIDADTVLAGLHVSLFLGKTQVGPVGGKHCLTSPSLSSF
jgi:hypothetical protein